MAEDRLTAPKPQDEHKRLAMFAGEWTGEEMVYPSRWNAGGPATSRVSARIDLNGFYLIQNTVQMRDGKESFATHGVFTYDREDRLYKLFWFDSLGGNARHVYEMIDDNSYSMKIQYSPDSEGWADVLTGTYRRGH